jgi:DNA/RNA endonuclease G (NUC1)
MLELISPNLRIIYNISLKCAHSIEYIIDPTKKLKGGRRSFIYDPRLNPNLQLSPDFAMSGYSRGHLVPSFVMSWDKVAWTETYRMTNIAIQNVHFNTGNWNKLELDIYEYAKKTGKKLNAITGVSEDGNMKNGYFIPDYFYTTIRNDYLEKRFYGENNHRGKIWLN